MYQPHASIIRDSEVKETGERLTTVEVRVPLCVLPKLLLFTFSFSLEPLSLEAALERIKTHPYIPPAERDAPDEWLGLRDMVLESAWLRFNADYQPSSVMALAQPWLWQTVLVTTHNYRNFFNAARRPDASPEFKEVRDAVRELVENNVPLRLNSGEWHLPFVSYEDRTILNLEEQLDYSSSLCTLSHNKGTLSSARHVAKAIGFNHPGLYPGWQAYSHFLSHNFKPTEGR